MRNDRNFWSVWLRFSSDRDLLWLKVIMLVLVALMVAATEMPR